LSGKVLGKTGYIGENGVDQTQSTKKKGGCKNWLKQVSSMTMTWWRIRNSLLKTTHVLSAILLRLYTSGVTIMERLCVADVGVPTN